MKKFFKSLYFKPKTFALTFWKSLTKPSYYKDILEARLSFSFKYFFSLLFVTFLIVGIGISVRVSTLIPQVPKFIESTKNFFVETYPKELKLTLKDGKIKTNVKEPYFIDLSQSQKASIQPFNHAVVISTKGKAEDIKNFDSLFLLTSDSLVVAEGTQSANYKAISLTETLSKIPEGASVDKPQFTLLLDKFQPYALKILPKIIILISLLIFILYAPIRGLIGLAFQAVLLIPLAFILFIVSKIAKKKLGFAKVYQMSLHGATIPVTLSFIFGFSGFYPYISIASWIAFFVFMFVVISKLDTPLKVH